MIKKSIALSILAMITLSQNIEAKDITKKASSEVGWRFGNFSDNNETVVPKTQKGILAEILKTQRKQLKVQKKILDVLQKRFDPQPEIIMVDGKPCIANSSEHCYKWEPEPEAKRYPVIAKFFSNPTQKNAAEYLKWYSKHMNHAVRAGTALMLAKYQYGANASNYNIDKKGMIGATGENYTANKKHTERLFKKYMDKFYLNVYVGRNLDIDVFGLKGFVYLFETYPKLKINLIFYNEDVKEKLHNISDKYKSLKRVFAHTNQEIVSKGMFAKHGIYATPTTELILKNTGDSQIMQTGRMDVSNFDEKVLRYLWFKKIIKDNAYSTDYKKWDDSTLLKTKMYERDKENRFNVDKYEYTNPNMAPHKIK